MAVSVASQQLDRMFFALADVRRRGMLDRLSRGPASATMLAEPLGLALPSAVKHLAVLEQGGFVVSRKAGRVRTYALEPKALKAMGNWVSKRKRALHAQFDRLDALLAAQQETQE
jgi:DNA-binding transcriptional ArsR family regulator